jgi:hypothetical protein
MQCASALSCEIHTEAAVTEVLESDPTFASCSSSIGVW